MIKIIDIKEHKNGSATFSFEYSKDLENIVCQYYNKKKFTKKLLKQFIIEGLENYLKNEK